MQRAYSFRQMAAVAAVSVLAGFSASRGLEPRTETIIGSKAGQQCGAELENSAIILDIIAQRAVMEAALPLRSELGAGFESGLVLEFRYRADPGGMLTLLEASASCGGGPCPEQSELPRLIGALISEEWKVRAPAAECVITLRAQVPAIEFEPCESADGHGDRPIPL